MTSERARVVRELSGFKLLKELGQGGMGKVFLARQTSLDRVVALKVLMPELAADREFVERFHREAKSAARFQHPNIVAVFDQGQDATSGVHYIAFEFVDGGSLEELLERRQRLPEAEALSIARAIATALEYAEKEGIVHRDVKPENILLTKLGLPKLADLGLAKQTGVASTVTQSGIVLGTPLYMAPEQALGEPDLDGRADLYALGLCLWRVLTGLVPFDEARDGTPLQLLAKHINHDLPDVRTRTPEVSEGAAKVIAWLAARDRASRYGSASDVVADLDLVMRGEPPVGPHERETVMFKAADLRRSPSGRVLATPAPAPRLPRPTAPILAGVLVGALGIGVGLALAVTGRKGRGGRSTSTAQATEVAPPTTTRAVQVATPAVVRRTSEPAPPIVGSARPELDEPPPASTTTASSPTLASLTSEPVTAPTPVVEPRPLTPEPDGRLVSTLEAGLRLLREAFVHDAERARPAWDALQTDLDLLRPSLDADAAAAVARLSSAVEALLALLEADVDARPECERVLDGILGASAAKPFSSRAGRTVDATLAEWAVLLADVAELEALLAETVPAERDKHAERLRTSELEVASRGLLMFCKVVDADRERLGRGLQEERADLRAATMRRGALARLLDPSLSDLESTLQLQRTAPRSDQGGAATALARVSLTRGAPTSGFLAARVVDVAPSSTGRTLGSARGLLVAAEGRFGPEDALHVSFGATELVIDAKKIAVTGGRSYDALEWGDSPVIVLEVRKSPLVLALDARTGEVLGSREVDVRGQLGAAEPLSYSVVRLGLTRVALLQPLDGEAHERVVREQRERAGRPRRWR